MLKNYTKLTTIMLMIVVVVGIMGCTMSRSNNTPNPPILPNTPSTTSITSNTSSTTNIPYTSATPVPTATSNIPTPAATGSRNTIEFNTHLLINNKWGTPPEEKLSSGIFMNQDKTFGWYWDRPEPVMKPGINGYQPIYPNVKIGGDIFEKPRHPLLPIKVSSINQLSFYVDYDYLIEPTGSYNLAYQMYFMDNDKPDQNAVPTSEVMIWIHRTFGQPPLTYKGAFTDDNNKYDLYSWVRIDGLIYSAFLMKGDPVFKAQHTVDAKKLLGDLMIDPNWYLFSVHLGNEVVNGAGKIQITKLEITMNGQGL